VNEGCPRANDRAGRRVDRGKSPLSDRIDFVIEKHGGGQLWTDARTPSAKVQVHGGFWAFKGQPGLLGYESVTADIHRQRISMTPFGAGRTPRIDGTADRVTITDDHGQVDELTAPRASMAGGPLRQREPCLRRPGRAHPPPGPAAP
jgi:hypothetical protein